MQSKQLTRTASSPTVRKLRENVSSSDSSDDDSSDSDSDSDNEYDVNVRNISCFIFIITNKLVEWQLQMN